MHCVTQLRGGIWHPGRLSGPVRGEALVAAAAPPATAAQQRLRLRIGCANLPHPDKAHYGGEDAFFMSGVGGGALGVADGVGGWQDSGVNPAEYSAMFMEVACAYLEGRLEEDPGGSSSGEAATGGGGRHGSGEWLDAPPGWNGSPIPSGMESDSGSDSEGSAIQAVASTSAPATALGALAAAHRLTRKPGSSTACVLRLDPTQGELEAANLGDSGFLVVRAGALHFRSPPLQHFFDCPFQFGAAPEFTLDTDTVDSAEVYRLALDPGDVVILATDGMLDNLPMGEVLEVAVGACAAAPGAAAAELARRAAAHAADPQFESPYALEAAAQGVDIPVWQKLASASFAGGKFELGKLRGGKMDDITVLVAVVEAEAEECQQR